jgi:septal ring factor EnvC (AmiA/AmiB activator)
MARIERESINFKLPKPLADALRAKAVELDTTATDLVIQGLQHVLGDVPGVESSVESRLHQIQEEFFAIKQSISEGSTNTHHEARLTGVESKLEELSNKLARFEGALTAMQNSINASKSRKSGYSPYNQYNLRPPQLEPRDEEQLALRLNTNVSTLREERTTLSPEKFVAWSRERDFGKNGWRYDEKSKLYHPVK